MLTTERMKRGIEAEAAAETAAIIDTCNAAGMPHLAAEFIRARRSVSWVRRELERRRGLAGFRAALQRASNMPFEASVVVEPPVTDGAA